MTQSLIGASVPQVTAREKVLGSALYVGDMKMSNMLHAKVLRSPHPHARIVHVDVERARRLPGVKAVITGADTPERLWGPIKKEHRVLATGKVRFAGEEVAAVAAVDEYTALDALELIRMEYEPLPAVFDPEEALRPGAPEVHEGTGNIAREIRITRGDVDAGFTQAAAVYEATYETQYQYHGYLEPMGTIAAVDGTGRLTVWAPTQSVYFTRELVAEALDITPSRVRVIQTVVGGAFGGKLTEDAQSPIAALLALKTGRPVRLVNNRLEDFLGARSSLPARVWLKMGLARDGEIVAKDSVIFGDNGAYSGLAPEIILVTAFRTDCLHRLQNVRTHARLVYTNKIPGGTFRAFGTQQMAFPLDSHLTVLAEMIGMDPVDVHLRNAIRQGETSVHGWYMGSCGLRECIEKARDGIGWKDKHGKGRGTGRTRRGVGIGTGLHVTANRQLANWDGSTVAIKFNEDGRVNLICGESDLGQGSTTVLTQICANELGLPMDHVTFSNPDTDTVPFCFGSFASRVTLLAGNAVIKAAREAREKLLAVAAEKLEVSPRDLTIEDAMITVVGMPARAMTVGEACRLHLFRAGGEGLYTRATYDAPTVMADKETFYGNVAPAYSFAAQAVEVEVDTETGQVTLIDSIVADDCGKALNPQAVEGQIHGAVAQGIGWALYENLEFEDGRLANPDFADYTMPTADSLPPLRSVLVETIDPNGPYGAKGASETSIVPTAGAIANAVYDAVGVRITSLPITPEKVLAALRARREAGTPRA
jgi:CO/xanthine dehydrogenase Mo-binding subunit